MTSNTISNGILKAIGLILGVALLMLFLYKIQTVLVYLVIASILSLIGRPIVLFFKQKLKFNENIAVIVTMVIFLIFISAIVGLFIPLVAEQSHNLSLLDINALQSNAENLYQQIINYFNLSSNDIQDSIKNSKLLSKINFNIIPDFLNSLIGGLGSFGIGLFSVLFISFFFLKDSNLFTKSILSLFPRQYDTQIKTSINTIKDLLSRYFGGLLIQMLILFVIYSTGLAIAGVTNSIIIATLCAILNIIPYVGPLISGFLITLLTMSSYLGQDFSAVILPKTIIVIVGFLIGQLVDNFFTQPFIFSKSVNSHPLEIFLIIMIFGSLFGIVGLVVAVPLYTAIKVIAKEFLSEYRVVQKLTKNL